MVSFFKMCHNDAPFCIGIPYVDLLEKVGA